MSRATIRPTRAAITALLWVAMGLLVGVLIATGSQAQDGGGPVADFGSDSTEDSLPVSVVQPGEYRLTSDYAPESSWLRSFDTEVVGVGELSAGADRTTWTFEIVIPGFFRLRQGDRFLTRDEDDSGPGRFVSLQPLRNEQRTQLWRVEPGTPSVAEPEVPTHRIVSAWGRNSGVLSRDSIPQDNGSSVPGDSASVYEWFDWESQRWFIVPTASAPPPAPIADDQPAIDVAPEPTSTTVIGTYLTITNSCTGLNGRLDVLVRNDADSAATFRLDISDLAPRFLTVPLNATGESTATGRPDGPMEVVLFLGETELERLVVDVKCDPAGSEAEIVSSCLAGNGHIEVFLENPTDGPVSYQVRVGSLDPRFRLLGPGTRGRVSVTGRSDGAWPVTVLRDREVRASRTLLVECDEESVPVALPTPTASASPIAFENEFAPPRLNSPIVIDSVEALGAYEALWPAYSLYCEGRVYEVALAGLDRDIVVDLRGEPALTIPLLVFGARNVAIVGVDFDMAVQPGCEAGQLETQPEEGGPFVDNLSIHPRLPTGGALRVINPGTTWIEGVYLNMNGIESDCMIANLGLEQTPERARLEREWIVVNSRCDAQEGASPGDRNGDGVHGDFLHFQGEGVVFAHLGFENVVHLSGANGVVAAQSLPDGSASGSVAIRNYYFDYNPRWEQHGPDSPSGGVPFVLLVDDIDSITAHNMHYRTVTGTCTGVIVTYDDAPERFGDPASDCPELDGLNLIAGSPEDPAGNPSPIAEFMFAPVEAIGSRYGTPLLDHG